MLPSAKIPFAMSFILRPDNQTQIRETTYADVSPQPQIVWSYGGI